MGRVSTLAVASAVLSGVSWAGQNGQASLPPMGWRSWNQFGCNVNQSVIIAAANGLADRSRMVDGVPTSLSDLGFRNVGLDDCWQSCGKGDSTLNRTFHDANGRPVVNNALFPDMIAMTNYIHSLNLTAGWYGNNCDCHEGPTCACPDVDCFRGDVNALIDYGFDTVKYDGCGPQKNMTQWWQLISGTEKAAVAQIENCGNDAHPSANADLTTVPYHQYRISTDIRPTYGSIVNNAQNVKTSVSLGTTGPTCWAYPDMLEVGVTNNMLGVTDWPGPRRPREQLGETHIYPLPSAEEAPAPVPVMSLTEQKAHFSLWCVTSSPLVLSLDFSNNSLVDSVWPIITNREVLAISQSWAGPCTQQSQGVIYESSNTVVLQHCAWNWAGDPNCTLPVIQQWYKPLANGAAAVLVMNHGFQPVDTAITLSSVPGLTCAQSGSCKARDLWARQDLGSFSGTVPVPALASHDVAFYTLSG